MNRPEVEILIDNLLEEAMYFGGMVRSAEEGNEFDFEVREAQKQVLERRRSLLNCLFPTEV